MDYFKLHAGHEQAHSTMLWIIILGLIVSFILIQTWRKWHRKSFDNLTLFGLWIVPLVVSIQKGHYVFLLLHLAFTACIVAMVCVFGLCVDLFTLIVNDLASTIIMIKTNHINLNQ